MRFCTDAEGQPELTGHGCRRAPKGMALASLIAKTGTICSIRTSPGTDTQIDRGPAALAQPSPPSVMLPQSQRVSQWPESHHYAAPSAASRCKLR